MDEHRRRLEALSCSVDMLVPGHGTEGRGRAPSTWQSRTLPRTHTEARTPQAQTMRAPRGNTRCSADGTHTAVPEHAWSPWGETALHQDRRGRTLHLNSAWADTEASAGCAGHRGPDRLRWRCARLLWRMGPRPRAVRTAAHSWTGPYRPLRPTPGTRGDLSSGQREAARAGWMPRLRLGSDTRTAAAQGPSRRLSRRPASLARGLPLPGDQRLSFLPAGRRGRGFWERPERSPVQAERLTADGWPPAGLQKRLCGCRVCAAAPWELVLGVAPGSFISWQSFL